MVSKQKFWLTEARRLTSIALAIGASSKCLVAVFHLFQSVLGGSSHLVSGLVHPSYKWINPTYPVYNWGYNPLTKWDEPRSRILNQQLRHAVGIAPISGLADGWLIWVGICSVTRLPYELHVIPLCMRQNRASHPRPLRKRQKLPRTNQCISCCTLW